MSEYVTGGRRLFHVEHDQESTGRRWLADVCFRLLCGHSAERDTSQSGSQRCSTWNIERDTIRRATDLADPIDRIQSVMVNGIARSGSFAAASRVNGKRTCSEIKARDLDCCTTCGTDGYLRRVSMLLGFDWSSCRKVRGRRSAGATETEMNSWC
jgi:hypothetical protein